MTVFIDPRAHVSDQADLADGVAVWAFTQVREGAVVGAGTTIGSHAYIDADVELGANCKVQSAALIFKGAHLGDGVFVGPAAVVTNDRWPRAISPDGERKGDSDWTVSPTRIETGATVGAFSLVGAGAVVTKDVPPHALVVGVPAVQTGWVCRCGGPVVVDPDSGIGTCDACNEVLET